MILISLIPSLVTAGSKHSSSCIARSVIPNDLGTDGPVISASRIPTLSPAFAHFEASRQLTRLLPTPPLPLTTPITFLISEYLFIGFKKSLLSFCLELQFWSDVRWGELDYLFVDMPPGTGDVALTVFQSLPIDGIVIVSTPQDLVKMIVNKAYNMAKMMNVPVLGLVENMSYYICPNCNQKINIFGESKIEETAGELGVPVLAKLPINPEINKLVDAGKISEVEAKELDDFVELLK